MAIQRILHYRLLSEVGRGGMGVVYAAIDERLDRQVAVKVLKAHQDAKHRNQFVWEAQAAARLRHPNIIVVHDIGEDNGADFIVMEFVEGHALSEIIPKEGMPLAELLRCATQVSSALETAHAAGVVHRDIKPSNILIGDDGVVKLADFGLARLDHHAGEPEPDREELLGGTRGYMAPEQSRGDSGTALSDIFSFGAVLYEMATGQRAFQGDGAYDEPVPPSKIAPRIPAQLEAIILQCLRKDPRRRYQHIGDVRLALEAVAESPAKTPGKLSQLFAGGRRTRLFGSPMVAVAAGIAVAAIAYAVWALQTGSKSSSPAAAVASPSMPLTSFPGAEREPAWSPDGRQLAFNWDEGKDEGVEIFLMQPETRRTLKVTNDSGYKQRPAWSPDGRWIAYARFSEPENRSTLNLISPLGGPKRVILSALGVDGPAWSPDGKTLIAALNETGTKTALWAIDVESGSKVQLTAPERSGDGDGSAVVSPNGKLLAFSRRTAWRTAELYLLDVADGWSEALRKSPKKLTTLGYVDNVTWTPDGERLVFYSGRGGAGLWQISHRGGAATPILGLQSGSHQPALARRPDGRIAMAYSMEIGRTKVMRYATNRRIAEPPVELAASTRTQRTPYYSLDGKRLAFSSRRTGYEEIWASDADGRNAVQLTELRRSLAEGPHWSPDGRRIAFVSQDIEQREIFVVGAGGEPPKLLVKEPGINVGCGWSVDGRSYYFQSTKSGRLEIWRTTDGGPPEQITHDGGVSALPGERGSLYYWRPMTNGRFALIQQDAGGREKTVALDPPGRPLFTTRSAGGIYYCDRGNQGFYRYDEATGRSTLLMRRPRDLESNMFHISPDGKWLVTDIRESGGSDLMIVEDFR